MADYVLNFSSGLFQLFPPSWEPLGQLCCIFILRANENILEAGPHHDPPLVGHYSAGLRVVLSALQAELSRTHRFAAKKSCMMFRDR